MKKQLHHEITRFLGERLPKFLHDANERRRQTDNVVVWITGLSVGAIALIISQAGNASFISTACLKVTVGCFLISVLSGVVFRAFIYRLEEAEASLAFHLEGYCFGASIEVRGPIEITENHSIEEIARSLKEDMGLDYDGWLQHAYLDKSFWLDHYKKWAGFWHESDRQGMRNLEIAVAPLVGKTAEEAEGTLTREWDQRKDVLVMNGIRYICNSAYILLLIFFGLAVLSIAIGFFLI